MFGFRGIDVVASAGVAEGFQAPINAAKNYIGGNYLFLGFINTTANGLGNPRHKPWVSLPVLQTSQPMGSVILGARLGRHILPVIESRLMIELVI